MEPIDISLTWLKAAVPSVGRTPLILIQGYEWTGFGSFSNDIFDFGGESEQDFPGRWSEIQDIRLFGDLGEWHCWKSGEGQWFARFAAAEDWVTYLERKYVVWGRQAAGAFVQESNGVRLFIPISFNGDLKKRPLRLIAWEQIKTNDSSGQAYIHDAMLRELRQSEEGE